MSRTPFLSVVVLLALVACVGLLAVPALADCGSVPFRAPFKMEVRKAPAEPRGWSTGPVPVYTDPATLDFDPLSVAVFEPKQRAIILWDGQEEILLLSTDQRASQPSAVLEVIPLPAEPTVRLGSFATFEAAQRLMVEKRMWVVAHGGADAGGVKLPRDAGRITFSQKMGAHDLSVAQVLDRERFVAFVQDYLQRHYGTPEAAIRPEFVDIIQSYIDEGTSWFAFDVIMMDGSVQSREPIEYRFKSASVYYPLRISTLEKGRTEVDLLVFTGNGATNFMGLAAKRMKLEPTLPVTRGEVEALDAAWKGFFGADDTLKMDQWKVKGNSATLQTDVRVK